MTDKNTKEEIQNELEQLSKFDSSARTKISKLKELLPIIENAIQSGVSKTKIVEVLNKKGLELSLSSYSIMMKRIKDEKLQSSNKVKDDKNTKSDIKEQKEPIQKNVAEMKEFKLNATTEGNKDDIQF